MNPCSCACSVAPFCLARLPLRALSFGRGSALVEGGWVALLHPLFANTTQVYTDIPAALATLLVAECLAGPPSAKRLGAASALCGALVWLTLRTWFAVGGLGLVIAVVALRARSPRLVLAGALPFAALVLANAWVNKALFDVFLPHEGYLAILAQQIVVAFTPQLGIPGLLLDRTFGLLARAPLYALAFFGAVPLWRAAASAAARSPRSRSFIFEPSTSATSSTGRRPALSRYLL